MNRIAVLSVIGSLAFFLCILELVRRRKLREEYSILWLSGSFVVLVLSAKQNWLERISGTVGIAYPPSFLFLVGMLFIVMILVHFSVTISKLKQMNKVIVQEIALLKGGKTIPGGAPSETASSGPAPGGGETNARGNASSEGGGKTGSPKGSVP
jgi:hypothetical protein